MSAADSPKLEAKKAERSQNIFEKVKSYAPSVKHVPGILWETISQAPRDFLSTRPKDFAIAATEFTAFMEDTLTQAWDRENKELRILVTGKTGQGKSTLINGLLGVQVAKEGAGAKRCTTEVEVFTQKIDDIPVTVFDSPGLQDNTENEAEYIQKMQDKCQQLSLVLYCTKMTNTRLGNDDKNAMMKLTKAFGEGFWNYAVFVLTFANKEDLSRRDDRDEDTGPEPHFNDDQGWELLKKKRFEGRVQLWKNELHNFLINEVKVNPSIAKEIPVIPTGDHRATRENRNPLCLPDHGNWFQVLWKTCCLRVKETQLFLKINSHRMAAKDDDESGSKEDEVIQESNTEEQKQAEV